MKTIKAITMSLWLSVAAIHGQGTILWDESVNGSFSQFSSTPTSLSAFQIGTNSVIGSVEIEPTGNNWFGHADFFTVQVPNGYYVNEVQVSIDGPQVSMWIGNPGFSSELAFVQNPTGDELLAQWGLSSILPGSYGLDIENHNAQPFTTIANYRLDFFVQAVPEPRVAPLLLLGTGLVGLRCWRKSKLKAG